MTNNDVENGPISEAMNALIQLESNAIKCYIISVQDKYQQNQNYAQTTDLLTNQSPFSPL